MWKNLRFFGKRHGKKKGVVTNYNFRVESIFFFKEKQFLCRPGQVLKVPEI
jgi:hypothetical protein